MIQKIRKWLFLKAKIIIAKQIKIHGRELTPDDLFHLGFSEYENDCFYQKNIKSRDKVIVELKEGYYLVFHGKDKTFIAAESTFEWFEMYYLLIHPDNGIHKLAGI